MELCKHLCYERSIQPGKAAFFYQNDESDFIPLVAKTHRILGQKCSFSEGYKTDLKPKELAPQDLAHGNPVYVETVSVPLDANGITCRFNLRVLSNSLEPSKCNDIDVYNTLKKLALSYKESGGYHILARKYAKNILLGEWLFRNQKHYPISVEVITTSGTKIKLDDVHLYDWHTIDKKASKLLDKLTTEISDALTKPSLYWSAEITAHIDAKMGEEIFPSQMFLQNIPEGSPTKVFSKMNSADGTLAVCFNQEKVNAGIQFIDDWHGEEQVDKRLRVHEYGADKQLLIARRNPKDHRDFYSLIKKAKEFEKQLCGLKDTELIEGDIHFVMSVLIKGGMMQRGKEK